MSYPKTIQTRTKVLVAMAVVAALASLVSVTRDASHKATLSKQAEFEAAAAIQLAARERNLPKMAAATY
jgi:ABC-type xylose transport system permease subunit